MSNSGAARTTWQNKLATLLRKYHIPGTWFQLGTAMLVGLGTGIGAIIFRWLIGFVKDLSFESLPAATASWGNSYLILAPALGGLLVGLLVYFFAPEAKGHGVPEVMEAVALRGGRIRPVVAAVKSLASALSIGTGGSVGREGPIVQIGSTLGSTVGQIFKLSDSRVRSLVACGAAGGVAATFNAPIAGVIFALEVILGNFSIRVFGTVVVASVTASVVGRAAFGDVPAFIIPEYAIHSLWEFPMYLVLGLIAAVVGVVYTRMIYMSEDLFAKWRQVPEWSKPAFGGALLGCMALLYGLVPGLQLGRVPHVYGVGYEDISAGLLGETTLLVMLALVLLKILATSLTLGSGGSGGVFAPSLFIGSMLGGSFGLLMHQLFPGLPGPAGAYALVGMGAVFAGATHASMTAVIIMFEMTGDYKIVLPLMLAVVISTLVSNRLLGRESIYTLKLTRRGVRLWRGQAVDVLGEVRVDEVMTSDPIPVHPDTPLEELTELFLRTNRVAFPVVGNQGELVGIVSLTDLRNARAGSDSEGKLTEELMTRSLITAFPDDTLDVVLRRMGPRDLSRLPVVARDDPQQLLGIIRRNDIVRAYNLALTRQSDEGVEIPKRLRSTENVEFVEIVLPHNSPLSGTSVAHLSRSLPAESLLVSIQRESGEVIFPHGDTIFRPGDRITACVRTAQADELRSCFQTP